MKKKDITAEGTVKKQAIIETILSKHDAATNGRRFNAILATSSINDAIEYYHLFKTQKAKTDCEPLKHCVCLYSACRGQQRYYADAGGFGTRKTRQYG